MPPPPSHIPQTRLGPIVLDSEMIVLGRCVQSFDAIDKVKDAITPDDLWQANHTIIFKTILTVDPASDIPPLSQVIEALRKAGQLEEVGTHSWFMEAIEKTATDAVLPYHLRRIVAASRARQAMTIALQLYEAAATGGNWSEMVDKLPGLKLESVGPKKRRFLGVSW